jgi:hypothetical protein
MFKNNRIAKLEEEVEILKLEVWGLKNPTKYYIGDVIEFTLYRNWGCDVIDKKGVIVNVSFNKEKFEYTISVYVSEDKRIYTIHR